MYTRLFKVAKVFLKAYAKGSSGLADIFLTAIGACKLIHATLAKLVLCLGLVY
jgi:hypothetical protein